MTLLEPENIKKLRTRLGLNQEELANKVGISQEHLSKIENGKADLTVSVLRKISNELLEESYDEEEIEENIEKISYYRYDCPNCDHILEREKKKELKKVARIHRLNRH